jgi:hypothetical protein
MKEKTDNLLEESFMKEIGGQELERKSSGIFAENSHKFSS